MLIELLILLGCDAQLNCCSGKQRQRIRCDAMRERASKSQLMQLDLSTCQCRREGECKCGMGMEREMKTEATRALLNYLLQVRCQAGGGRGVYVLTHAVLFAPAVVAVVFCFVCISNCHLSGRGGSTEERQEEGEGAAISVVVHLVI